MWLCAGVAFSAASCPVGMAAGRTERTPLVAPASLHEHAEDDEALLAQESAFSAIYGATQGGDPSASLFLSTDDRIPSHTVAPCTHSLVDRVLVMSTMWIGTFVAALDTTMVATVLSQIGSEFAVSKTVAWLGTSYMLMQMACQPLYGCLSDAFGRRTMTLFASSVFFMGTLLCGLSCTFVQLCVARAMAGMGGSGLTSLATMVVSDVMSVHARGTWQGLGNAIFAIGAALGGPLGGVLVDAHLGWRWAFLLQVPLCAAHLIFVFAKVRIPAGPGPVREKLQRIDFGGTLVLVCAVTALVAFLACGDADAPRPLVYLLFLAALACIGVFVFLETHVAAEPLMPTKILLRRMPACVSLACGLISMCQFGLLYHVPLYFIALQGTSTVRAGAYLVPNAIAASVCSLGSGMLVSRTGSYRAMVLLSGLCAVLGCLGMCFWNSRTTPTWAYWLTMPWVGAGFGSTLTVTLVALVLSVDPMDIAPATGVTYLFRAVGSIMGVSCTNSLLQRSFLSYLRLTELPPHLVQDIRADVGMLWKLTGESRTWAVSAYEKSMHAVFLWLLCISLAAVLCLCFIREQALLRHRRPT